MQQLEIQRAQVNNMIKERFNISRNDINAANADSTESQEFSGEKMQDDKENMNPNNNNAQRVTLKREASVASTNTSKNRVIKLPRISKSHACVSYLKFTYRKRCNQIHSAEITHSCSESAEHSQRLKNCHEQEPASQSTQFKQTCL